MPVDPRELRIQLYPAEVLRTRAKEVEPTDEVRAVAARMIEVMRSADGIGLAAPQVGLPWRLFVCDVPPTDDREHETDPPSASDGPQVFLNPVVERVEGTPEPREEGCLSLPGILGEVMRPPTVRVRSLNADGAEVVRTATGLLGRCWLHEIDHLDGVLIIDKMTAPSRLKTRSAVKQLERRAR